ncbi:hypothetical protein GGQ68_001329 [Sagittula marina]|uniref:Uncharacterized protein n=2 Tax=Sagittula marina TaxID=943940 RepID=A0A7W6DKP0_9RHOB|nr:hypothetical protein [Sagittula marina]
MPQEVTVQAGSEEDEWREDCAFARANAASTSSTSIEKSGTGVPDPPSVAMLIWTGAVWPDANVTIHP